MDFYTKMKQNRDSILSNEEFSDMPMAYHDDLLTIPKQLLLMGFANNDELPRTFQLELTYPWKPEELKKIFEEVMNIEVETIKKNKDFPLFLCNSFIVRLKK